MLFVKHVLRASLLSALSAINLLLLTASAPRVNYGIAHVSPAFIAKNSLDPILTLTIRACPITYLVIKVSF